MLITSMYRDRVVPSTASRAGSWLTAPEAIVRLGVRPQTLYAYVSRGLIASERVAGARVSRYSRADVERLASRARRTRRDAGPEIVIDSALTQLDPAGHLHYRGWDVTRAAVDATYEQVAEWLWGTDGAPSGVWSAPSDALDAARRAQAALPDQAKLPDRLRIVTAAIGSCDPLRDDRRVPSVAARARGLIATLVEALPTAKGVRMPRRKGSIAERLWTRVSPLDPTPARVRALDCALVLLADHELAASTLAVRIAASTWADPYLLVGVGLAAAGGPLHAGASEGVRLLLREIADGTSVESAVGARLREAQTIPGFGHAVYQGPDPRATALLDAVRRSRPPRSVSHAATQVLDLLARDEGPHANVDFALGTFAEANSMVPGASEAIFVIARCAGWIAHGLEEYQHRLRYRIRAAYTGPAPQPP
jgi:citrate synthase